MTSKDIDHIAGTLPTGDAVGQTKPDPGFPETPTPTEDDPGAGVPVPGIDPLPGPIEPIGDPPPEQDPDIAPEVAKGPRQI